MAKRITIILLVSLITSSAILVFSIGYQTYRVVTHDYEEQGRQNALVGARTTEYVLEKTIANGIFDIRTLFDNDYELIEETDPPKYHSGYDHYFDRNIKALQDAFLDADPIYYAYAINDDGYVPVHTDPELSKLKFDTTPPLSVTGLDEEPERFTIWKDAEGYEYHEYRSPINIHGRRWGEFRVGIPVALVEGKVKGQTALSAGATAFCSLVLAALIYVVVRRSLRPLPDLSAATARMAAGDFKARISYKGRDELGVLARSFNRMADKLAVSHETLEGQIEERTKELAHKMEELQTARNAALNLMEDSRVQREIAEKAAAGQAEARARFEAVIENTPLVAIQGFDREGKISMWNSASEHIHGYSAPQVLGRRLQDILLAGEVAEEFEHLLKEMWDTGQIAPPREWPVHTGDGEKRLVYASMFPIFERGKVSEIICMNVDITERKRAEEESRQAKEAAEAASGELAVKVKELEEFNRLAVGREMHIIEMKRRINGLHEELGKAPPYDLSFADADGVESDA